MTGPEWQAELVRLGMEAIDRVFLREYNEGTPRLAVDPLREAMTERMAQAAQAIVIEVDGANERARKAEARLTPMHQTAEEVAERERLDRIDATARAMFLVLAERPVGAGCNLLAVSRAYGGHAYDHAEQLENARAAWLAKRGQR